MPIEDSTSTEINGYIIIIRKLEPHAAIVINNIIVTSLE